MERTNWVIMTPLQVEEITKEPPNQVPGRLLGGVEPDYKVWVVKEDYEKVPDKISEIREKQND